MNKITKGTIIRTACLVLALTNQVLAATGKSPLPIDNDALTQSISLGFTIAASLVAWWKNNSFTKAYIEADAEAKLKKNKAQ